MRYEGLYDELAALLRVWVSVGVGSTVAGRLLNSHHALDIPCYLSFLNEIPLEGVGKGCGSSSSNGKLTVDIFKH